MIATAKKIDAAAPPKTRPVRCSFFDRGNWSEEEVPLPAEMSLLVSINGRDLLTILCTADRLEELVTGFLYAEGIIPSAGEIEQIDISLEPPRARVQLRHEPEMPKTLFRTPSGISYGNQVKKADSAASFLPEELLGLMRQLREKQPYFGQTGGFHASALAMGKQIITVAEDIGRHNTVDKIIGHCLREKLPAPELVMLTTGRISSEMVLKAASIPFPVIVSKAAPTERAARIGEELGITIVGYVREDRLSVFTTRQRITANTDENTIIHR